MKNELVKYKDKVAKYCHSANIITSKFISMFKYNERELKKLNSYYFLPCYIPDRITDYKTVICRKVADKDIDRDTLQPLYEQGIDKADIGEVINSISGLVTVEHNNKKALFIDSIGNRVFKSNFIEASEFENFEREFNIKTEKIIDLSDVIYMIAYVDNLGVVDPNFVNLDYVFKLVSQRGVPEDEARDAVGYGGAISNI